MPATAASLDSACSAAVAYADAIAAERRLLDHIPAPGHPDRATFEAILADVGRIARQAYRRLRRIVVDLIENGDIDQAISLMTDVQDLTSATRMLIAISTAEDRP